jgi:hypothetical protein
LIWGEALEGIVNRELKGQLYKIDFGGQARIESPHASAVVT